MELDNLRIVAVDPGNNLGVAVVDYCLKTRQFKVKDAYTLNLSRLIPNTDEDDKRDISLLRLAKLKQFLKSYVTTWCPDIAAHETAYVPNSGGGASVYSYASLVENILTVKFSFIELQSDIIIFEINPTRVKLCVAGIKSSDKTLILNALIADKDIDLSGIDISKLNQHNADAIAIAITCAKESIEIKEVNDKFFFKYGGKTHAKRKK